MEDTQQPQLSLGQMRVGISFNPSGDPVVNEIKEKAADLIDLLETLRSRANVHPALGGEIFRAIAIAQTHVEDAAMWGVKAATKK
jgi:hypothetical protein